MIQIDNTIISLDLISQGFLCDLSQCFGICCLEGDSGAPLTEEEQKLLPEIYPKVKAYLTRKGIEVIDKEGFYMTDSDGDVVTPLIDNRECAYAIREKGVWLCAIEKAFELGEISFQKPLSCHLYPVRITEYRDFTAVNYDREHSCSSARKLGKHKGILLYRFLKEPLIRQFGQEWYDQLDAVATNDESEQE